MIGYLNPLNQTNDTRIGDTGLPKTIIVIYNNNNNNNYYYIIGRKHNKYCNYYSKTHELQFLFSK